MESCDLTRKKRCIDVKQVIMLISCYFNIEYQSDKLTDVRFIFVQN